MDSEIQKEDMNEKSKRKKEIKRGFSICNISQHSDSKQTTKIAKNSLDNKSDNNSLEEKPLILISSITNEDFDNNSSSCKENETILSISDNKSEVSKDVECESKTNDSNPNLSALQELSAEKSAKNAHFSNDTSANFQTDLNNLPKSNINKEAAIKKSINSQKKFALIRKYTDVSIYQYTVEYEMQTKKVRDQLTINKKYDLTPKNLKSKGNTGHIHKLYSTDEYIIKNKEFSSLSVSESYNRDDYRQTNTYNTKSKQIEPTREAKHFSREDLLHSYYLKSMNKFFNTHKIEKTLIDETKFPLSNPTFDKMDLNLNNFIIDYEIDNHNLIKCIIHVLYWIPVMYKYMTSKSILKYIAHENQKCLIKELNKVIRNINEAKFSIQRYLERAKYTFIYNLRSKFKSFSNVLRTILDELKSIRISPIFKQQSNLHDMNHLTYFSITVNKNDVKNPFFIFDNFFRRIDSTYIITFVHLIKKFPDDQTKRMNILNKKRKTPIISVNPDAMFNCPKDDDNRQKCYYTKRSPHLIIISFQTLKFNTIDYTDKIVLPLKLLDLRTDKYTFNKAYYNLCSVIIKRKIINQGDYVSYTLAENGKWRGAEKKQTYNDLNFIEVSEVKTLFYSLNPRPK